MIAVIIILSGACLFFFVLLMIEKSKSNYYRQGAQSNYDDKCRLQDKIEALKEIIEDE